MTTVRSLRPQYSILFSIGEIDLTMRVQNIMITNSIKTVYPIISIEFGISSKDYFIDKIYGQENAFLQINVTGEDIKPSERIELELVIIHMDTKVSTQRTNIGSNETNQLEDKIKIICLLKDPYLSLSSTVNFIFNEKSNANNNSFVENILNELDNFNLVNIPGLFDSLFNFDQISNNITNVIDPLTGGIIETRNISDVINDVIQIIDPSSRSLSNILRNGGLSLDIFTNSGFGIGSIGNVSIKQISDQFQKIVHQKNNRINSNNKSISLNNNNTPLNIVRILLDKYIQNSEKNIIDNNMNTTQLNQLVIPPKSLIGCIRYINDRYGIFKGPLFIFCDMDNNINLWDISKISDREVLYTTHFIAPGTKDSDFMKATTESDNVFYTYKPLVVKNKSNTSIMTKGYEHIVIKRPRNKFSDTVKKTLDDVSKTFKINPNPELIFNDIAKSKKIIHTTVNANSNDDDKDDSYLTSKMASYIASCSSVSFRITGSKLPIKKLSSVGGCVDLVPHTVEYLPSGGKYIVGSSIISLTRENTGHYVCLADIVCFRESLET